MYGTAYNQIQISEAGGQKNVGGYAEYIATREGVEKIDESRKFAPVTNKQKQLIKKILLGLSRQQILVGVWDYLKDKTVGAASEFITRMLEENADEMMHTKNLCRLHCHPSPCGTLRLTASLPTTAWRWI